MAVTSWSQHSRILADTVNGLVAAHQRRLREDRAYREEHEKRWAACTWDNIYRSSQATDASPTIGQPNKENCLRKVEEL